ncbi:MAG: methyltransferase domain-containing protein [SAR202 cluster bacterium]|jgi:ubiquinone/menaquinone biosynthesis C-methylase UbiE|nr:methyltransferase domain-containing protein [SAR202 cluster bacterium]MDP6514253.1 methyltransferase domain-containing protein [SAR202 cluster bacterium]MDP6714654.1 methyltransferase domain-containing protein [SAR202 cluster bacterium]
MTTDKPEYDGRPAYGYDAPVIHNYYSLHNSEGTTGYLLPHLKSGMTLLDCGCGPGTITLGLAQVVAPAQATGIDIEPGMIEQAKAFAAERGVENVEFQQADILNLPFADNSFDVVLTSAVLEHLNDPESAVKELHRVVKKGGLVGVVNTDWGDPLISPENESVSRFFEIFERGFNLYGGSLNRGRHARRWMREAGLDVFEFKAQYGNASEPEAVQAAMEGFIGWVENVPIFDQAIELGWTDAAEIQSIIAGMRAWSKLPDAFIGTGRTEAVARKP